MTIPICEHIKASGRRCGSPAKHESQFCYFHSNLERAMPLTTMFYERDRRLPPGVHPLNVFELPPLEDPASIQIGFMQLIHGVAHGLMDTTRARIVLSALHGAAANLRLLNEAMPSVPEEKEETAAKKPAGRVEGNVAEKASLPRLAMGVQLTRKGVQGTAQG